MAVTIKNKPPALPTNYGQFLGSTPSKAKIIGTSVAGSVSILPKGAAEPAVTQVPVNGGAAVAGDCKVGCGGSRTVNLGNYESVKISVWLEMPCNKDSVTETFDFVSDWVGNHLTEAVKSAKGD